MGFGNLMNKAKEKAEELKNSNKMEGLKNKVNENIEVGKDKGKKSLENFLEEI